MDYRFNKEQEALHKQAKKLADEKIAPLAPEVDESSEISMEVVRIMADENLYRYAIPEGYGGYGIKVMNLCIIREELSRVSVQADSTFAMQGLGTYPISYAGSHEQKAKYLPAVASGARLATFALTEPEAGSDVASMKTNARLDGDFYILNGQKRFISQAPTAELYSVFAKTDPSQKGRGISAFIVEKGMPGFDPGRKLALIAAHCIGEPKFENCRVPRENLIGQPGGGMRIALSTLDVFRTSVGAACVGLAQAAYDEAIKYAKTRVAFGQTLSEYQATQFKLADMATEIQAARLLVFWAATLKDGGQERVIKEASMAKLFASEVAGRAADQAVQIHGGMGLIKGVPIERIYRECRAPRIYEGTSEIQRLTISRELLRG